MLIGLAGTAGSGKDTAANFLVERHGFVRVAFADAVRDAALALNPWVRWADDRWSPPHIDRLADIIRVDGWDKAKREKTEVRRLLQVIGTEVGREILGPDVWVIIAAQKINALGPNAKVVITDVRFPNEVGFVRAHKGVIAQVTRPNNPDAIAATHASEKLEVKPDYILSNSGTLAQLEEQVSALVGWVRYTYSNFLTLNAQLGTETVEIAPL